MILKLTMLDQDRRYNSSLKGLPSPSSHRHLSTLASGQLWFPRRLLAVISKLRLAIIATATAKPT